MSWYSYKSALTAIKNEFTLGDGYHLTGLGNGAAHDIENYSGSHVYYDKYTYYPKTERYYGETTDYVPVEGGTVSINMKKCVFGLQINVNGLTDGALNVRLGRSSSSFSDDIVTFSNLNTDGVAVPETIFTFEDVYDCWLQDTYSLERKVYITWTRGNSVTQELEPRAITLKRNVLTTININLSGSSSDNGFSLDLEDDEMTDESTNWDFNAGDMTETPVEPTE